MTITFIQDIIGKFMPTNRPLRVFLCHSSNDKPAVRELYQKLRAETWIEPWLDEEELYPGDDWELEIEKAVEKSDVVLVCLSNSSINKRGFVQKELRFALDIALEMPEETIFIIPLRLDDCSPPRSLRDWQYVDYFEENRESGFQRLLVSLKKRVGSFGLDNEVIGQVPNLTDIVETKDSKTSIQQEVNDRLKSIEDLNKPNLKVTLSNGIEFIQIPLGKFLMGSKKEDEFAYDDEKPQHILNISYDYWITRFPITNDLYNSYVIDTGIEHPISNWENKKKEPVTHISWFSAMKYCKWLYNLLKDELPSGMVLRLPTEAEWEKAARGIDGREYPWGNKFDEKKCNSYETGNGNTTPVDLYSPHGDSPYGVADMVGNVWEWTHSVFGSYPYKFNDGREKGKDNFARVIRGGSYNNGSLSLRCAKRDWDNPINIWNLQGFRIVASIDIF